VKPIFLFLMALVSCLAPASAQTNLLGVPILKGLVFVSSLKEVNGDGVPAMTGLAVHKLKTIETPAFRSVVAPFLGRPLDDGTMKALQAAVVRFYRDRGLPIVDVVYLDQDVSNGVVQVAVLEGRLGRQRFEYYRYNTWASELWSPKTNGWNRPTELGRQIHVHPGELIYEPRLQQDIQSLDRNPLRELRPYFTPGAQFGESDLVLRVYEQRPYQFSVGYEDTGTRLTDLNRISAGAQWAKAFGWSDNVFTYQFLADPAFTHLRAHSADYVAPLGWGHRLHVFGYYLNARADLGDGVELEGPSYQASFRYEVPLPSLGAYRHHIAAGLDFKSAENNLALNSVTAANTPTEIFQVALGYTGILRDPWGSTAFSIQSYISPGDVTAKNTDAYFEAARFGATASYAYGRLELQRETHLPGNLSWVLRGSGQLANGNLLPTEQLGLGGYNTVRGYDDRQVNSDEGWILVNELRSPPFSPLSGWARQRWGHDTLQVLAFFDYGEGSNIELLPGETKTQRLSSVGVGLRYAMRKNLEVRFDYGWQLEHLDSSPVHSRGHVSATLHF
jgi:hemolysin activation/secretion protein